MGLQSLLMAVVENTWMVSTATMKYLLTGLVLINLYRYRNGGLKKLIGAIRQAADRIPMKFKSRIVYGMTISGIIATATFNSAGIAAAAGITVYIIFKIWNQEVEEPEKIGGVSGFIGYIIQISAVLTGLAAIFWNLEILNSLAALYIYLVIFWKI